MFGVFLFNENIMYAGDNKAHDKILPINKIMVTHHPQNNQEGSHQNLSIYYM